MNIGKKIQSIRTSKGFSEKYVSEKAKIDITEYKDIENGSFDLRFTQLENISFALECEIVDIINHQETVKGVRNYFYNHQGYNGTNIHVQGIDQEEIRKAYKELYIEELNRIPRLEKLLRENNIDFNI